jgi:hypothetical protein
MTNRYEAKESKRQPGLFHVVDTKKVIAVKMNLPHDSAIEEAAKLNRLFPAKEA